MNHPTAAATQRRAFGLLLGFVSPVAFWAFGAGPLFAQASPPASPSSAPVVVARYSSGTLQGVVTQDQLLAYAEYQKLAPVIDVVNDPAERRKTFSFPDSAPVLLVRRLAFAQLLFERLRDHPDPTVPLHTTLPPPKVRKYLVELWTKQLGTGPSDKSVRRYYDAHPKEFTQPEQVQLSVLFLRRPDDPAKAREKKAFLEELRGRGDIVTDFFDLVRQYGENPNARSNAGKTRLFSRGTYNPTLEAAAFSLEVGQVSRVLETDKGFFLLKALKKVPQRLTPFKEAAASIRDRLTKTWGQDQRKERLANLWKGEGLDRSAWTLHVDRSSLAPSTVLIRVGSTPITLGDVAVAVGKAPDASPPSDKTLETSLRTLVDSLLICREERGTIRPGSKEALTLDILEKQALVSRWLDTHVYHGLRPDDKEIERFYEAHKGNYLLSAGPSVEYILFPYHSLGAKKSDPEACDPARVEAARREGAQAAQKVRTHAARNLKASLAAILPRFPGAREGVFENLKQWPDGWVADRPAEVLQTGETLFPVSTLKGLAFVYVTRGHRTPEQIRDWARPKVVRVLTARTRGKALQRVESEWLDRAHFKVVVP